MTVHASVSLIQLLSAILIAFTVLMYAILDGADLGVGTLIILVAAGEDREIMINSILPVWDGNETWLVLAGGALIAMFPLAYSSLLTARYPVLIVMLFCLICRGVALEFRASARPKVQQLWDRVLFLASVIAGFCQGISFGAIVHGTRVSPNGYAGGRWDWLSWFSIGWGVVVVCVYGLLATAWLFWRTEGALQRYAQRLAPRYGIAALLLLLGLAFWTSRIVHGYARMPELWIMGVLREAACVAFGLAVLWFIYSWKRRYAMAPLVAVIGWIIASCVVLSSSLYPYIAPPTLSISAAASPLSTQLFVLKGCAFLIPAILAYSTYSFWVFRGKVRSKVATDTPDGVRIVCAKNDRAQPMNQQR